MKDLIIVHDDDGAIHANWLVRCKDCRFRDDPGAVISLCLPCQFGETTDDFFCACGVLKDGENNV